MKKQSDKNSATSAVAGFVGAINDRIPLPAGVELRSEAELIIWHQFYEVTKLIAGRSQI